MNLAVLPRQTTAPSIHVRLGNTQPYPGKNASPVEHSALVPGLTMDSIHQPVQSFQDTPGGLAYEIHHHPAGSLVIAKIPPGKTLQADPHSFVSLPPQDHPPALQGGFNPARLLSGDDWVRSRYVANSHTPGMVMIAPNALESLQVIRLNDHPKGISLRPGAFFAADDALQVRTSWSRPGSSWLQRALAGEWAGFQEMKGQGHVIVSAPGTIMKYDLKPGQEITFATEHLLGYSGNIDLQTRLASRSLLGLFGQQEGLINSAIKAKDHATVWLHSLAHNPVVEEVLNEGGNFPAQLAAGTAEGLVEAGLSLFRR